jgi:hypothetical protein
METILLKHNWFLTKSLTFRPIFNAYQGNIGFAQFSLVARGGELLMRTFTETEIEN